MKFKIIVSTRPNFFKRAPLIDALKIMQIPYITLRDNTERPRAVEVGTNELIGVEPNSIKFLLDKFWAGNWKKGSIHEIWDGHADERINNTVKQLNA